MGALGDRRVPAARVQPGSRLAGRAVRSLYQNSRPAACAAAQGTYGEAGRAGLQRLTEPGFEQGAKGAADPGPSTALQHHLELAVGQRLELHDALQVDDGRPVDADEAPRI